MRELFPTVIASAAKQSRYSEPIEVLDCFAALAMTGLAAPPYPFLAREGERCSHA
jgi:hypothetical protein